MAGSRRLQSMFLILILAGICTVIYNTFLYNPVQDIGKILPHSGTLSSSIPSSSLDLPDVASTQCDNISNSNQCTRTVSSNYSLNETRHKYACVPQTTVAFIKTLKTGSMTLQSIINRFGFINKLSFIFNKKSAKNGHFYHLPLTDDVAKTLFLPPLNVTERDFKSYRNYDIIAVHVRYDREAMDRYLASDAKYITIIRDPASQWESAFTHFRFHDAILLNVSSNSTKGDNVSRIHTNTGSSVSHFNDSIDYRNCENNLNLRLMMNSNTSWVANCSIQKLMDDFLRKPYIYRERLKLMSWEGEIGRRYYYSRNLQIFDLGLRFEDQENHTAVQEWIKRLDKEFSLVLINEYYDESLLILRKVFCWRFEDIVYIAKNVRVRLEGSDISDDAFKRKVREWNYADRMLYNHFNRTLWNLIRHYGPTFETDLAYFRNLLKSVKRNCTRESITTIWDSMGRFGHREFVPLQNASLFCQTVAESKASLHRRIYSRQYQSPPKRRLQHHGRRYKIVKKQNTTTLNHP